MKIAHGACSGINILLTRLDLTTYDLRKPLAKLTILTGLHFTNFSDQAASNTLRLKSEQKRYFRES